MALGTPSGLNWVIGGLIAALLLPGLAIGLDVPFWLAIGIAAVAGAGGALLLAPRPRFDGLDANALGRGRIDLARELLDQAEPLVERMRTAADAIRAEAVRARVGHLTDAAGGILTAIEKDPLKLDRARRFLTYYLPSAVEMVEGYGLLEQKRVPDTARLQETGAMLDRLDVAFSTYSDGMMNGDLDRLDIELKLLKSALDEDLGPAAGGAPAGRANA